MKRWSRSRRWLVCLLCLLVVGCGAYRTVVREIGYKGKARLDAYLAAERFLEQYGYEVESRPGWPDLDHDASMLMVPASVLTTEAYVREVTNWVAEGGHLICLVENAESYIDDWWSSGHRGPRDPEEEVVPVPLQKWLTSMRLEIGENTDKKEMADALTVEEQKFQVFAESYATVSAFGGVKGVFGQSAYGEGLITVMTDARPFRNRYISDHEHAAMLLALTEQSPYDGRIIVVRDAALSLWDLLWRHAWAALIGLLVLTFIWLWKNMPRFGPMRREEARNNMRDYDHHLEALGDFQWRLDRGQAMLRPLRESVLERAQRLSSATQRGLDLFEWIGERAGIGRERAERAMTQERPPDAGTFTRVIADLQKIHLSLS